jgi:predicted esterase
MGKVILRKEDGSLVDIPFGALDPADQAFVQSLRSGVPEPARPAATKRPPARRTFPHPGLAPDRIIQSKPGRAEYTTPHSSYHDGRFAVYVPPAYTDETPLPLVVSAHGAGGNGTGEIGAWQALADRWKFIVVCPSYACAARGGSQDAMEDQLDDDEKMLLDILDRVDKSLNIDREHVMHTGFSGGGVPTWYIAMNHAEWFTALCFRSANFYGTKRFKLHEASKWRDRPIYIFWGTKDHPIILNDSSVFDHKSGEGPEALDYLQKQLRASRLKHEILEDGGHASRADLAAAWFAEAVAAKP